MPATICVPHVRQPRRTLAGRALREPSTRATPSPASGRCVQTREVRVTSGPLACGSSTAHPMSMLGRFTTTRREVQGLALRQVLRRL